MRRSLPYTFAFAFTISLPAAAQIDGTSAPAAVPHGGEPTAATNGAGVPTAPSPEATPDAVTEAPDAEAPDAGAPDAGAPDQATPATEVKPDASGETDAAPTESAESTPDSAAVPAPEEKPKTPYDGPATLLDQDKEKMHIGGYGGLSVLGTSIHKTGGLLVGGEGALLLDHRLAIGIAGYGLASEVRGPDFPDEEESILGFGYGGAVFRYHLVSKKSPVTASVGTMLGAGGLTLIRKTSSADFDYEYDYEEDTAASAFFIAEPSLQVNLHFTRWMRMGVSGGYRFVRGPSLRGIKDSELEGVTAGAHAQFGWF